MKTKKTLFKISGILKIVVGAGVLALFLLMLLLNGVIKEVLIQDVSAVNELVESMILDDPEYKFLLELNTEEIVTYMLGTITPACIIMIVWGLASVALGIFTIVLGKKYDIWLRDRLGRKIAFTVIDYIGYIGLIANILATIAVFIKDAPIDEMVIEN